MIGKRVINEGKETSDFVTKLKGEKACRICSQLIHWYKKRDECMEAMRRRRADKRKQDKQGLKMWTADSRPFEEKDNVENDSDGRVQKELTKSPFCHWNQ